VRFGTFVRGRRFFTLGLAIIVLLGLALRLRGIHDPILDHPGWRQGDTAAIARNFATLDYNPLHPQTDYDGPPPNYVELELQIVPFLAATLYKIFGIHEVFGRLISIAFSLATIVTCAFFARFAFRKDVAGLAAALAFAVFPGSVYYGRTFMPDTAMTFFFVAAVFASVYWIEEERLAQGRGFWIASLLTAAAILAKPVAIVALVPIVCALVARRGGVLETVYFLPAYGFAIVALAPYLAYDAYVRSIAEWHWSSGITTLHVVPGLRAAFGSPHALLAKLNLWRKILGMLPGTMLGIVGTLLAIAGAALSPKSPARVALWAWLGGALSYAFVVVTVERVDYYLYLFLPLAAIWIGGLAARFAPQATAPSQERVGAPLAQRIVWPAVAAACTIAALVTGTRAITPYYTYSKAVYARAEALHATLAPGTLVVMGHYDPSVLYYIGRKGWEEDPYLWTPFDEQSAIAKGARYFIAIEDNRLKKNVELSHWLLRFPVQNVAAVWPVYETDPAKIVPGAEARWQDFRKRERSGTL
jgi:4-amino-4-deoxy-L-arabinose transferase-like glycosyltransferase